MYSDVTTFISSSEDNSNNNNVSELSEYGNNKIQEPHPLENEQNINYLLNKGVSHPKSQQVQDILKEDNIDDILMLKYETRVPLYENNDIGKNHNNGHDISNFVNKIPTNNASELAYVIYK